MDYHRLLYVLEKVKAACSDEYGVYYGHKSDDDYPYLLRLVADGVIRVYLEDGETTLFRPAG